MDMFDEIIICNKCNKRMTPIHVVKNGFRIRTLECSRCGKRIYHPADVEEFKKFQELKQRPFRVKLRIVGNSYAVSIPKEIIDFMQEQEQAQRQMHQRFNKMQNEMVKMFVEEAGKISLFFQDFQIPAKSPAEEEEEVRVNVTKNVKKIKNKVSQ